MLLAASATVVSGVAAESDDARVLAGVVAWEAGEYPRALRTWIDVLESEGGDEHVERIALVTGELHPVRQLAPDGGSVRIAPDGRGAAWRVGDGVHVRTVVMALDGAGESLELRGEDFAFSPDGRRGVYRHVQVDDELEEAEQKAAELREARDFSAWIDQRERIRWLRASRAELRLVDLETGQERVLDVGDRILTGQPVFDPGGRAVWVAGAPVGQRDRSEILRVDPEAGPRVIAGGPGYRVDPRPLPDGRRVLYRTVSTDPVPRPPAEGPESASAAGASGGGAGAGAGPRIVLHELATGGSRSLAGSEPVISDDGDVLAWWYRSDDRASLRVLRLDRLADPVTVFSTVDRTADLAVAPSGGALAFRRVLREDWEIFVVRPIGEDGPDWSGALETVRVTREIQHDLFPDFLDDRTLLTVVGEGRHRRSRVHDLDALEHRRLFHNNTVRTIAPEYEWAASADGTRILIVAERDGDTVSPERGVYLVDRSRRIDRSELLRRLHRQLEAEVALREWGAAMFEPVADRVREAVAAVSMPRLYRYQEDLFEFGSKFVTEPGNAPAREYIAAAFASWGYEPELQWFEPEVDGETIRTANVLATLEGTTNPDLVYVLSSHFDSSSRGPGADDNTSGTAVLLETARVLADRSLPATVIFAAFTGEEAGLLGSREFVRRAEERGLRIVGALNNDMLGWSNDQRLDNTIRYSNDGIRDLQHAAAIGFSELITYDARYYKSTDAAAYYEAYGDIVGGIGSYPVLGNPHYHRRHDVLETINHELVRETTRATVASVMLLASSPARLAGLRVVEEDGGRVARWDPAPEADLRGYEVRLVAPVGTVRPLGLTDETRAEIPSDALPGEVVEVRAITRAGLHGWDWARAPLVDAER